MADALGSLALVLPSYVTLGNSPDALVSPGIRDGGIGALGFGGPSPADCTELVRGALTPLEAARAHYQHGQLVPTAAGLGMPVASRRAARHRLLCR